MAKFNLTFDITLTHTIEVEAENLEDAQNLMSCYNESDIIQDFAENVSTMDCSGASIDKVSILGEDGSELYY